MAFLHLRVNNFILDMMFLAPLLLIWGTLLLRFGDSMMRAKFEDIALVPSDIESLKIYT